MRREKERLEQRIKDLKERYETREQFLHRALNKFEGRCSKCSTLHDNHSGCPMREDQDR